MSASRIVLDEVDAIIFDLGDVIIPLKHGAGAARLGELFGLDAAPIRRLSVDTGLFQKYEEGAITSEEFRARTGELFRAAGSSRSVSDSDFDDAWSAILGSVPNEHLKLLARLKKSRRTFLLSNTNEIHIQHFKRTFSKDHPEAGSWSSYFEQDHYSFLLKLAKPDPAIFRHIVERHALVPNRTLFIDDRQENVEAACDTGLLGVLHPPGSPLHQRFAEG